MREMNTSDFWKNFRLGEEIHISGSFIYNALRQYHEMELLDHTDELFEFLYNLSVGIERLLKIAVVLHEHTNDSNQEALEQSLITHSHLELMARLRKHVNINFGKPQNDLLQLLGIFYKTLRYDRFSLTSVYKGRKEELAILGFVSKHLKTEISAKNSIFGTNNEDRYRAFIRRTVLKISQALYKVIEERSSAIGLYTYELRYESKAASVFLREIDIRHEDILWKELLIFFMNANPNSPYLEFLKGITPLPFDAGLVESYLECFKSDPPKAAVMDELEHHYEQMDPEDRKRRLEFMGLIGAPNVSFGDNEDCDEFFDGEADG